MLQRVVQKAGFSGHAKAPIRNYWRQQQTGRVPRPAEAPARYDGVSSCSANGSAVATPVLEAREQVLDQLRRIIDPDFEQDIVTCGFVKELQVTGKKVSFELELTTPACPIKDEFERDARAFVSELEWVDEVDVKMTAQPPRPAEVDDRQFNGLKNVAHLVAVSSCKGGVGKSTVAVNLAYSLAQMGARVGIFDADVYGPSLPCMVDPEQKELGQDEETKALTPVEYMGVKCVSVGFTGVQSAIMRGPMSSGLVTQLLTTTKWGELDYLVVDFPPGTGDIQLTLCQLAPFSAAVIVTTPQKLAFIDVAKGIRMFAKLMVPCVAVAENMSYFEAEGKRYFPFGKGSGQKIQEDFGLPNLVNFPIAEQLSLCGDSGKPLVVESPASDLAGQFQELGACVVREIAKQRSKPQNHVTYDSVAKIFRVNLAGEPEELQIHPATLRRNDTSASSINEWTGQRMIDDEDIPNGVQPESVNRLGNYAVQINWEDGFNQVAAYELIRSVPRLQDDPQGQEFQKQLALQLQMEALEQ